MNTRKYSKTQESRVAKNIKGKRQPNSGATRYSKGDVITDDFCVECKTATTQKASFSIKKEWVDKLKEEAFAMNKPYWSICFNFGGLENKENLYIISEQLFKQLQNYIKENE
jgi:hypothetical protein